MSGQWNIGKVKKWRNERNLDKREVKKLMIWGKTRKESKREKVRQENEKEKEIKHNEWKQ